MPTRSALSCALLSLCAGAAAASSLAPVCCDEHGVSARALRGSIACFPDTLSPDELAALVDLYDLRPPTLGLPCDTCFFVDTIVWTGTGGQGPSGRAQKASLTYSFPDDGVTWGLSSVSSTGPNNLNARLVTTFGDLDEGREFIRAAFASWRRYAGLTYSEVADNNSPMDQATATNPARGDIRIGGRGFGTSSFLAYNAFPSAAGLSGVGGGDMCVNTSFFIGSAFNNSGSAYRYLRNTIAHEHGHGTGNIHTVPCNDSKLMEPFISTAFDMLQTDEIRGAGRNYGDRFSGNQSQAKATNFKTINNKSIRETLLSTNGASGFNNTDEDWFKFKLTKNRLVTITVTPTGGSYTNGQQSFNCSGSTSTVNAGQAGDLVVELRSSSSVIQTSTGGGPGGTETINAGTLTAGTYFIRVRDQGPNSNQTVQLYTLDIQVASKKSFPTAIAGVSKRVAANTNCYFLGDLNSYATEPGASITKYDWDFNNDGVFDVLNTARPVVQFTAPGTYTTKLRVKDSNNKAGTDTIQVVVHGGTPFAGDLNDDLRVDLADLALAIDSGDVGQIATVAGRFGAVATPLIMRGEPAFGAIDIAGLLEAADEE